MAMLPMGKVGSKQQNVSLKKASQAATKMLRIL